MSKSSQEEIHWAIAAGINDLLNGEGQQGEGPRYGFVLLIAEFGNMEGGRVSCINNGDRASMISMLREYLARLEGRYVEASPERVQ